MWKTIQLNLSRLNHQCFTSFTFSQNWIFFQLKTILNSKKVNETQKKSLMELEISNFTNPLSLSIRTFNNNFVFNHFYIKYKIIINNALIQLSHSSLHTIERITILSWFVWLPVSFFWSFRMKSCFAELHRLQSSFSFCYFLIWITKEKKRCVSQNLLITFVFMLKDITL